MVQVVAQAMGDDAPDHQLILLQDVARRVGGILRAQYELPLVLRQAFHKYIAVEACHHHMSGAGLQRATDDQVVVIEDAGADHAVTADGDHIGVRGLQIQQCIERQLVLHVIKRRAGKAGRDACIEERESGAAALQRSEDKGVTHNGLTDCCVYVQYSGRRHSGKARSSPEGGVCTDCLQAKSRQIALAGGSR